MAKTYNPVKVRDVKHNRFRGVQVRADLAALPKEYVETSQNAVSIKIAELRQRPGASRVESYKGDVHSRRRFRESLAMAEGTRVWYELSDKEEILTTDNLSSGYSNIVLDDCETTSQWTAPAAGSVSLFSALVEGTYSVFMDISEGYGPYVSFSPAVDVSSCDYIRFWARSIDIAGSVNHVYNIDFKNNGDRIAILPVTFKREPAEYRFPITGGADWTGLSSISFFNQFSGDAWLIVDNILASKIPGDATF